MLPEKISNNICSLIPNEKRNVLVCNIQFDDEGIIQSYNFSESIICSHKRLTYDEVDNFKDNTAVCTSLESLKLLTKKRLKKRFDRSALDIETNEPMLILNENGEFSDLLKSKRLYAHQMIEESMISANICAADFMKKKYDIGLLYGYVCSHNSIKKASIGIKNNKILYSKHGFFHFPSVGVS